MEEKRKITSGNKIPGCERLTRPEEIQGLSKYLGAIRDTQEQWISENMPDSPLSGPEDAKLKEIKLPDKRLKLDGNKEVVLPNHKEHLDTEQELHLPLEKEKLDVPDQGLKVDKIGLDIGKEPELPKDKELIHPKDPTLPDQLERIHVEDPKLIQGKERLVVDDLVELPKTAVGLHVEENIELPKEREKIYPSDVSLPKSKETLNNIDDPELPNGVIDLQDLREISLPEGKEGIYPEHPKELPSDVIGINPEEPNDLRQHIEDLFAEEPNSLRQKRLGLHITEPDRLPWEIIEISPGHPKKLPDDRIDISVKEPDGLPKDRLDINPADPELPNSRIDIEPEDVELPNSRVDIKPDEPEELPKDKLVIDPSDPSRIEEVIDAMSENELYEETMKLLVEGKYGGGSGNLELAGILSTYLGGTKLSDKRAKEAASKIAEILEKQKSLLLKAGFVGKEEADKEVEYQKRLLSENLKRPDNRIDDARPEKENTRKSILDKELYQESSRVERVRYQTPDSERLDNIGSYLNPATYDQDRYIRRLAELVVDKGGDLINYGANAVGLNIGSKLSSSTRQYILKNTLIALVIARNKLEKLAGIDRSRLPGGSLLRQFAQKATQGGIPNQGIGDVIRGLGRQLTNFSSDTELPQRRPEKTDSGIVIANSKDVYSQTFYHDSSYSSYNSIMGLIDEAKEELSKAVSNNANVEREKNNALLNGMLNLLSDSGEILLSPSEAVKESIEKAKEEAGTIIPLDPIKDKISDLESRIGIHMSGIESGIALTLHDLCPDSGEVTTIEELQDALIKSPYITTPYKLMGKRPGLKYGRDGGNLTLDTNAYWELVITPYVRDEENGGYSYLPSIYEINKENQIQHGVNTYYSYWMPISNFELQKSKIVSKSLGLFDGEINYPISVEYTNELRITVVDDQYKSWRRYFQRCADVSTYFSEAHSYEYYLKPDNLMSIPTAIDKRRICVAYYKNLAFNIKVYCMTPQYSTIKKFDLLCVMKDFSEDYMGEIEGGGQDLNISFSVVGENPPTNACDYSDGVWGEKWLKERKNRYGGISEGVEKPTMSTPGLVTNTGPKEGLRGVNTHSGPSNPDLVEKAASVLDKIHQTAKPGG